MGDMGHRNGGYGPQEWGIWATGMGEGYGPQGWGRDMGHRDGGGAGDLGNTCCPCWRTISQVTPVLAAIG